MRRSIPMKRSSDFFYRFSPTLVRAGLDRSLVAVLDVEVDVSELYEASRGGMSSSYGSVGVVC